MSVTSQSQDILARLQNDITVMSEDGRGCDLLKAAYNHIILEDIRRSNTLVQILNDLLRLQQATYNEGYTEGLSDAHNVVLNYMPQKGKVNDNGS